MSNDWPIKTVAECASSEPYSTQIGPFGKALTPAEYTDKGVPLLRGVNVNHGRFYDDGYVFISEETADRLSKFESYPGDVLLVHKGTLGNIGLMPKARRYHRYIMGNSMLRVRCNPAILLPEYLYYWLSSAAGKHYLLSRVSQVGVPQINRPLTTLREARLPVPPLRVQQRIVNVLGTLDDRIELNRRMNRTLERMAAVLFKSWFVDFAPVRAKAEGRDTGLPAEIADLFPDSFEDSELGEIPKAWTVKLLPEAIEVNPSRYLPRGMAAPYVEMSAMPTRVSRPSAWPKRELGSGSKFRNGDVLVARITPCLENGKTAFVDFLDGDEIGWGSTEYIVLCSRPPLPPEFTYFLARSDRFREHAIANMTGTSGRQRVPATCFDQFGVIVPSEEVATAFGNIIQPALRKSRANDFQSKKLEKLRDVLLPKLLSGELEGPEVERQAGEVAR